MPPSDGYKLKILLLDKLEPSMRRMEKMLEQIRPCECLVLHSVRDALQRISQQRPDLILTEWRLRDHTAVELLKALKIRKEWESIPVIICAPSGSPDLKLRAKSLGAAEVLVKPIAEQVLSWHLNAYFPLDSPVGHPGSDAQAAEESSDARQNLRSLISGIKSLAPLPTLAQTILDIGNDPNSSTTDLRAVIEKDQSLTAKILKTVNSAYYGFPRKIGNIDRAIVILGFNEIMNLTLAACIIEAYRDSGPESRFNRRQFWIHALGAAHIARKLSTIHPGVSSKDAFVIGLLHDFGKVVLDQHFHELFNDALEKAHTEGRPLHQVTVEIANLDHAEVGGIVAENWKLPRGLVNAIMYHHAPELSHGNHQEVALAHLANYFCHHYKIGDSGNPVPDPPNEAALAVLNIQASELDAVWESLQIDTENLSHLL